MSGGRQALDRGTRVELLPDPPRLFPLPAVGERTAKTCPSDQEDRVLLRVRDRGRGTPRSGGVAQRRLRAIDPSFAVEEPGVPEPHVVAAPTEQQHSAYDLVICKNKVLAPRRPERIARRPRNPVPLPGIVRKSIEAVSSAKKDDFFAERIEDEPMPFASPRRRLILYLSPGRAIELPGVGEGPIPVEPTEQDHATAKEVIRERMGAPRARCVALDRD